MMKCIKGVIAALAVLAGAANAWAAVYNPSNGDPREGFDYRFTVPKGSSILLYDNVKLSHVTGIRGDFWCYHSAMSTPWLLTCEGPLDPSANKEGVYHWNYDAEAGTATCEFQGKWNYAYLMVATLKLTQVGTAIYAEVIGTTYPHNWPYGYYVGENVSNESYYEGLDPDVTSGMVRMSLQNVELDYVPSGETRNVKFYGRDGALLKEEDVEYSEGATAPTPPEVEGYVFYGWDADFSSVKEDMVIHALYHQIFTVVFKDADGEILKTTLVEETTAAEAPDMSDHEGFLCWDTEFDCVMGDMVVTAVYGTMPDEVAAAVATGVLENESNVLIWSVADGTWYTKNGASSHWKDGATAVFAKDVTWPVTSAMTLGKVILLAEAKRVVFTGEALTFAAPATVQVPAAGTLRFETAIAGADGFTLEGADATSLVEFSGDYAAKGRLAVNAGKIAVVGEGTLFGGNWTESGSRCESPLYIGTDSVFEFNSSAAQMFAMMVNATNEGSGYGTIKKCVTNGRFVIGPAARAVAFACTSEGLHRIFNGVDIYGTASFAHGLYHLFNENSYGITVQEGGVLNAPTGLGQWGHRDLVLTCLKGGVVNYSGVWSMGVSDKKATFDGGEANFTEDYSDDASGDILHRDVVLRDGATLAGEMMTWCPYYVTQAKVTVDGTEPSRVTLDKIRIGQKPTAGPANDGVPMRTTLVVSDVTGDARPDLTISSSLFRHAEAVADAEKNLGLVKEGAGTVLFTGNSPDYTASLTLKAGTVAFGLSAVLGATTLILTGDAEMNVANGAKITFADSSAMAWTVGKMLTFSGDMGRKSVRIGTTADGLTAAQLAQIQFRKADGKMVPMTIDSEGYLIPPTGGLFIRIR